MKQAFNDCILITFPISFKIIFYYFPPSIYIFYIFHHYSLAFGIFLIEYCIPITSTKYFYPSNPLLLICVLNCVTQYLLFCEFS
jgi:hypothetical protein